MSRFAVVHEDPEYVEDDYAELEIMEWLDQKIDGGGIMKGQEITAWSAGAGVGKTQLNATVVKEPQSEDSEVYYGA